MTPEMRAFLGRPQALIVTKANVKSRVHRRVHLDYIGVKLFLPNGRLRGELRLVGLFTSDAYTSTPGAVPYLRLKVAKVIARAGFDPSSHSGRALLNVLDTYPRDELFQIDEDTLYRFAVEIMNLSERPRIRALARIGSSSIASCRSSSSSRRTATIPPSAAASASSWRPFTTAACRPPTRPIRKGSLARTHYIIGRDEGATPVIERDVLEARHRRDRAHLERPPRRGARRRGRRPARPRARGALRQRLQRRLSRSLRRRARHRRHRDAREPVRRAAARRRPLPPRRRSANAHQPEGLLAAAPALLALRARAAARESRLPRRQRAHLPRRRRPAPIGAPASGCTTWRSSGPPAAPSTSPPSRARSRRRCWPCSAASPNRTASTRSSSKPGSAGATSP